VKKRGAEPKTNEQKVWTVEGENGEGTLSPRFENPKKEKVLPGMGMKYETARWGLLARIVRKCKKVLLVMGWRGSPKASVGKNRNLRDCRGH